MAATIIYARVSTDEQARRGISIPSQIEACRQYAEHHGYSVATELTDDESGAILARSGMDRLRELVRSGAVERVIVWRQDRLARDELGYFTLRSEFRRHNVEVHAVNRGGKIDGLYASLEAVLDADERERIRDRTMSGRMSKAKRGKMIGHGRPPYGYQRLGTGDDIQWHVIEDQAAVIRMIYRWRADDILSHSEIAQRLTEQGVQSPSDLNPTPRRIVGPATWNRETVRWILHNPTYTGTFNAYRIIQPRGEQAGKRPPIKLRDAADWVPIPVPAIVDQELWDRVQAREAQAIQLGFRNARHTYLVARRVRCSCGLAMTGRTSSLSGRNHKQYPYYSCNSKRYDKGHPRAACDNAIFRADLVDAAVWGWVMTHILNRQMLMAGIQDAEQRRRPSHDEADVVRIEATMVAVKDQRDRLNRSYVMGTMRFEEYEPLKQELDQAYAAAERTRAAIPSPASAPSPRAIELVETWIDNYAEQIAAADTPLKRLIFDNLDIAVLLSVKDGEKRVAVRCNILDFEADLSLA